MVIICAKDNNIKIDLKALLKQYMLETTERAIKITACRMISQLKIDSKD